MPITGSPIRTTLKAILYCHPTKGEFWIPKALIYKYGTGYIDVADFFTPTFKKRTVISNDDFDDEVVEEKKYKAEDVIVDDDISWLIAGHKFKVIKVYKNA